MLTIKIDSLDNIKKQTNTILTRIIKKEINSNSLKFKKFINVQ
jgi:hypothetical protein